MTCEPTDGHPPTQPVAPQPDQIAPLLTDLLYPSESDEPVEWVTCPLKTDGPLTVSQIREWLMRPAVLAAEHPPADFWLPVTGGADWYGPEEKARMTRFEQLRAAMQPLADQQLFRVGDTEIDLYLLGRLPDGSRAGVKTMVVET